MDFDIHGESRNQFPVGTEERLYSLTDFSTNASIHIAKYKLF